MNTSTATPTRPANLHLPIEAPRQQWPGMIEYAADALTGRRPSNPEALALELRAIAEALRMEVAA